jgi:hypothetical protein
VDMRLLLSCFSAAAKLSVKNVANASPAEQLRLGLFRQRGQLRRSVQNPLKKSSEPASVTVFLGPYSETCSNIRSG